MTTYRTPLALAQKLISLPSYVSDNQDETPVADFLASFLTATFPSMIIEKQYLKDSRRCNLLLRGKSPPKLFVLGHIDTVQPKLGWQTDPLRPVVHDDRLYGLGASDMKSSLAAFLWALAQQQQNIVLDEFMLLMYVDEEYDFKGIRRFLADDTSNITPSLTLSLDGELALATGCRGLIEFSLTTKGKSGHSSNPQNGLNAIAATVAALNKTSAELAKFADAKLGMTTTNIAYLRGGVLQEVAGKDSWLREGNIIPDTAEAVFEVRPAVTDVDAKLVMQKVTQAVKRQGLTLQDANVRHDIAPWPVEYDKSSHALLQRVYATAKVPLVISDRRLQGYIDAQMVAEKVLAPTFIVGTGGESKHGANENVPIKNIKQASSVYAALLREVLGR